MSGALSTATRLAAGIGQSASALTGLLTAAPGQNGVTIGGVRLDSFEVPQRIQTGMRQALTIHRFPGGARVFDAMGPDPEEIGWSGTILGGDTVARAQQLEALATTGRKVALTWNKVAVQVIVTAVSVEHGFGLSSYRIACAAVPPPPPSPAQTPVVAAQGGVAGALSSLSGGIATVAQTAGQVVQTVQQTIGSVAAVVTPITNALGVSVPFLGQASVALSGAAAGVSALSSAGAGLSALSGALPSLQSASSTIGQGFAQTGAALGGLFSASSNGFSANGLMAMLNLNGQAAVLADAQAQTNVAIRNLGAAPPASYSTTLGSDGAPGAVPSGVTARAGSPLALALDASPNGFSAGGVSYGPVFSVR